MCAQFLLHLNSKIVYADDDWYVEFFILEYECICDVVISYNLAMLSDIHFSLLKIYILLCYIKSTLYLCFDNIFLHEAVKYLIFYVFDQSFVM